MDLALNFDLATDYKLHDPYLPPNLLSFSFQICTMFKKKNLPGRIVEGIG